MRRWMPFIGVIILILTACKEKETVVKDETQTCKKGCHYCYWKNFSANKSIRVEFELLSGNSADILLLTEEDYNDYVNTFKKDTIDKVVNYIIPAGLFELFWSEKAINKGDWVSFYFSASIPCSVAIAYKKSGQMINKWWASSISYEWKSTETDSLIVAVMNCSSMDANVSLFLCKRKSSSFNYIPEGTKFKVSEFSYSYTIPSNGNYYIVIDNTDIIGIDDALPTQDLQFHIKITEK